MSLLVIILVAGLVLYAMIFVRTPKRSGSRGRKPSGAVNMSRADIYTRWQTIMATSDSGAAGLKIAVSDADKLVDNVMRSHGFRGDTMAERLKDAKSRINDYGTYDGLWRAHKLRNSLAHDVSFDLVPSQAKEALRDFERGLKALGAL